MTTLLITAAERMAPSLVVRRKKSKGPARISRRPVKKTCPLEYPMSVQRSLMDAFDDFVDGYFLENPRPGHLSKLAQFGNHGDTSRAPVAFRGAIRRDDVDHSARHAFDLSIP